MRQSLNGATRLVASELAGANAPSRAAAAAMGAALALVIAKGRSAAQRSALTAWASQVGPAAAAAGGAARSSPSREDAAARRSGNALAARWTDAKKKLAAEAAERGETIGPVTLFRKAAAEVSAAIDRVAATETAAAWNAEQRRLAEAAEEAGLVLVYTWEAENDRRTCQACAGMNGQQATEADGFVYGWPPLHMNCRCQVSSSLKPLH